MRKSDVLVLIVGTNPMPNIISIISRVEENGKVYLIHSNEESGTFSTEEIAKNLIQIFKIKIPTLDVRTIPINMMNKRSMVDEVSIILRGLINETIELNYTGGTKLISSTMYSYFKSRLRDEDVDIILSYLDYHRELFVFEEKVLGRIHSKEEKINIKLNDKISLVDIIKSHGLKYDKDRVETMFMDISIEMFRNFQELSIEEKHNWVTKFNNILTKKDEEKKTQLIKFQKDYVNNYLVDELEKLNLGDLVKYVLGDNLEEYIFDILNTFKKDKIIDDFVWSYIQKKRNNSAAIEIDFVIIKDIKSYLLSVTLCEEEGECMPKLYEAKVRAEQLSGDETRVGFICLYNSYRKLGEIIDGNCKYSNNLVIAIDNFTNIKEKIKEWIGR